MMEKLLSYFKSIGKYKINLILSAITLLLVLWLSSGTLSFYNLSNPILLVVKHSVTSSSIDDTYTGHPWDVAGPGVEYNSECLGVAGFDHEQFYATFMMLDGADKSSYEFSVVLRRILFPIIAYPFMKLLGYDVGGTLASFVLHLITFFIFVSFVRREIGEKAAYFAMWAIATFPGIAYFGGNPYSYAIIFPCFLVIVPLLWHLAKAEQLKSIFFLSLGLGIAFLGYDLLPIFGLAALLIMLRRKMFWGFVATLAGILIPNILVFLILKYYFVTNLLNGNNALYGFIALSYFGVVQGFISNLIGIDPNSSIGLFLNKNAPFPNLAQWFNEIILFPLHLIYNFLGSSFIYFPILFILLKFSNFFGSKLKLNSVETYTMLAMFILFIFNNLAPPYRSNQMRGFSYVRIYEPLAIILILYISRKIQTLGDLPVLKQRILLGFVSFFICLNLITSVSTFFPTNLGLLGYSTFWMAESKLSTVVSDTTSAINLFRKRIEKYGKYPIGTCAPLPKDEPSANPENK